MADILTNAFFPCTLQSLDQNFRLVIIIVLQVVERILFVYAKLNPGLAYVQVGRVVFFLHACVLAWD